MSSKFALIFIGVAVLFILGMKFLSSPKTARYGNLLAAAGMLVAFLATIPLMQFSDEHKGLNLQSDRRRDCGWFGHRRGRARIRSR